MLSAAHKKRVKAATVRIVKKGGQGVLVPGGFVLTAAHCITWYGEGGMALGDYVLAKVTTKSGAKLTLDVYAVEPRADIAVLGGPDNQALSEEAGAFEEWWESTEPVPLSDRILNSEERIRVHVLTHDRGWISGDAVRWGPRGTSGTVGFEVDERIPGGTSGGAIVDDDGRLLGVVSQGWVSDRPGEKYFHPFPLACLALPRWVLDQIADGGES